MRRPACLFLLAALTGWAAEGPPPVTEAAQPPSLTAEVKAQVFRIQRDIAQVEVRRANAVKEIEGEAERQTQELQGRLQELLRPLVPKGWWLDADLNLMPPDAEAKAKEE